MVADYLDDVVAYYMRVKTADVSAAKAYVEQRLPEVEFLDYDGSTEDEIAFVTQPMVARESHTLEQDLETEWYPACFQTAHFTIKIMS